MMYSNAILSASGNNTISVKSMSDTNLIATGTGDDVVTIGSALNNTQISYPLNKGILTDPQVRTILTEANITDYGDQTKALVHLGDGSNTLTVTGSSNGIDYEMGTGNDTVSINQFLRSSVTTGAGDDSVVIKDWIGGATLNGQFYRSGVDLGNGNDVITIDKEHDKTNGSLQNSVVYGGAGQDRLNLGDELHINLFYKNGTSNSATSRYPIVSNAITVYDVEEINLSGSRNKIFVSGLTEAMDENTNKEIYVYQSAGSNNEINFMNSRYFNTSWTQKGGLVSHTTTDGVEHKFYEYSGNTGGKVFVEDSINVTTSGYYI